MERIRRSFGGICNMKTVLIASIVAVICSITVMLLIACVADNGVPETEYTDSRVTEDTESQTYSNAQYILDVLYDKVELKDGRIYLAFGARDTLTVENFNKLILEDQLGCAKGRFSFVIDRSLLTALRGDNAYGGIGFDQEWITTLKVQIMDTTNAVVSEPKELILTLFKSKEADLVLRGSSSKEVSPEPIIYN